MSAERSAARRLERVTFRTSRTMDFFSEKELVTQTGHARSEWPLVIVKELLDNSLDACEEADVAPVLRVTADAGGLGVADNGPGLPEATLTGALDFTVRVSNREAYVSPCRGAQGNALKTLFPMPRILDPEGGRLVVTSSGQEHTIICGADPVSQRPQVRDDRAKVKSRPGTAVRLEWRPRTEKGGHVYWPFHEHTPVEYCCRESIRRLVEGFAVFNPHTTVTLDSFGTRTTWKATDPAWKKWRPDQRTSAHWYEVQHLERLIAAYLTHDEDIGRSDRLVSDFLALFDGFSGSPKRTQVLEATGLKRARLSEFVVGGRLDTDAITGLLTAMQQATRPVPAYRLGLIGEEHLRRRLLGLGIVPESFRYRKLVREANCKNSEFAADGELGLAGGCLTCSKRPSAGVGKTRSAGDASTRGPTGRQLFATRSAASATPARAWRRSWPTSGRPAASPSSSCSISPVHASPTRTGANRRSSSKEVKKNESGQ